MLPFHREFPCAHSPLTAGAAVAFALLVACSIPAPPADTGAAAATESPDDDDPDNDTGQADDENQQPVTWIGSTECTGDTGGVYCSGERDHLEAEYKENNASVRLQDWGVVIDCGQPEVTALLGDDRIDVTYINGQGGDCVCKHILTYRIHDIPTGDWVIHARGHRADVTIPAAPADTGG
jgi:hypothetical protein